MVVKHLTEQTEIIAIKFWAVLNIIIKQELIPCLTNLSKVYKMNIGKDVQISWKAHLDKSVNPRGIHIGDGTHIVNGAMILAHDACRRLKTDTLLVGIA